LVYLLEYMMMDGLGNNKKKKKGLRFVDDLFYDAESGCRVSSDSLLGSYTVYCVFRRFG
jgi:hypothetical protein